MTAETLYRYNVRRWSLGADEFDNPLPGCRLEVLLDGYLVLKRTPKGAWIDVYGVRRFVLLTARKQFACETAELAAESFRRRKTKQISLLKAQQAEAVHALRLLESMVANTATNMQPATGLLSTVAS